MMQFLKIWKHLMIPILFLILVTSTSAQTSISFIGHLNTDAYPDTLIAKHEGNNVHLPHLIRWGQLSKNLGRRTTVYIYPSNWKEFQGSFFVDHINIDTIADIVFILRGKLQVNESLQDTSLFLTILGGEPIVKDTVLSIDKLQFSEATLSQNVEMKKGIMLIDEANRTFSGGKSYKIAKINTAKLEIKNTDNRIMDQPTLSASTPKVTIYPNPGQATITAQFTGIAVGEYSLDLMDVVGIDIHKYPFEVTAKGANTYSLQLDVTLFPTGVYVLRLFNNSKHIISSQFIINH
ncbi:MAG: T9SS type A sorting domain-containing protein [Ignavibacteria bacterium]|nr:T9SS type A sorting domain-containing protein [Ignavibacteria bacterium]